MRTPDTFDASPATSRGRIWLGAILICIGLLGHLLSAALIGGSRVAYTHHIFGFFLILVVSGAIIAALRWAFWRDRPDIALLSLGAVQAILGVAVYVMNVRKH